MITGLSSFESSARWHKESFLHYPSPMHMEEPSHLAELEHCVDSD